MPQMEPSTLNLQWNTTVIIIFLTVVLLSCYILPLLAKLLTARTHLSI